MLCDIAESQLIWPIGDEHTVHEIVMNGRPTFVGTAGFSPNMRKFCRVSAPAKSAAAFLGQTVRDEAVHEPGIIKMDIRAALVRGTAPSSVDSRGVNFQAAVATGVWSSSNSIGVSLPSARCRRRRW